MTKRPYYPMSVLIRRARDAGDAEEIARLRKIKNGRLEPALRSKSAKRAPDAKRPASPFARTADRMLYTRPVDRQAAKVFRKK